MKIRDKLTFLYSFSTAFVLLVLGFAVYFFFSRFRSIEFFDRLNERVEITEKLFLEEKKLEPEVYQRIRRQFSQILPQETEEVHPINNPPDSIKNILLGRYPAQFVENLFLHEFGIFSKNHLQGSGKKYQLDGKEYVVIVTAYDTYGLQKLEDLREILLFAFPISILMIVVIGRLGAKKAFEPVVDKIHQVNTISASSLHKRLDIHNPQDEIGQLGITFNQMLDRLEDAFEMQKNFISNASHELRNPLTTIIGEAEICLSKDRQAEDYIHALQTISTEAERLNSLVNNLLNLAKTDFSKSELIRETVRLDEVLMQSMALVRSKYSGQRFQFDAESLPEEADTLELKANQYLLHIAITNLLDNACKFSGDSPVKVWFDKEEHFITICIKDQGVGIPADDLKRIRQPFYRAGNVRQFRGFGIGLPLSEKIIRLHGGILEMDSKPGEGTFVKIKLPLIS